MERSTAQAYAWLILWMEEEYGWDRWRAYDLLTHVGEISVGYYAIGHGSMLPRLRNAISLGPEPDLIQLDQAVFGELAGKHRSEKGTDWETVFGHKVFVSTGASSLILDCVVERGNPADSNYVQPFLDHRQLYGKGARAPGMAVLPRRP